METASLFRVETVELTTPPRAADSLDIGAHADETWCRYVITNRTSRLVGRYRGSLAQARRNAEQLASSFNDRLRNNRSAYSPRAKAPRRPTRTTQKTARVAGTA